MYGFRPIPERLVSEGLDAARPDPELRRMPVFFQTTEVFRIKRLRIRFLLNPELN